MLVLLTTRLQLLMKKECLELVLELPSKREGEREPFLKKHREAIDSGVWHQPHQSWCHGERLSLSWQ